MDVRVLEAELLLDARAELGEGARWDKRTDRLAWIDILARQIHLSDPATGATVSIEAPSHVGCIAPRRPGGWIAALADGFWTWDAPGGWRRIAAITADRPDIRFNDGRADPLGRFWAGTMAYDSTPRAGALYRLDPDGRIETVLDDVSISNGIVFPQSEAAPGVAAVSTCYYVDTPTQRIDVLTVDPGGRLHDRRPLVEIPASAGAPDGLTIDADGGLWLALWGGGAVRRYRRGRLDTIVRVPASRVTSCAFGGRDLDELFITSAWAGLSDAQRATEPLAGGVFRVRPGVRGVPEPAYAG